MQARISHHYCKLRDQESNIAAGPKKPKGPFPKDRSKAAVYFQQIITITQPTLQCRVRKGPVRATMRAMGAARTGPVSIWPRAPKWPHMGLTARVSWRLNADFLHDVFWRCNADFQHGFHGGLMPISCTVFMVV